MAITRPTVVISVLLATGVVLVQWAAQASFTGNTIPFRGVLVAQVLVLAAIILVGRKYQSFGRLQVSDLAWGALSASVAFIVGGMVYVLQAELGIEVARPKGIPGDMRAILFLYMVILAPLLEEWLFRGVLLSVLRKHSPAALAIFAQAFAFAAYHLSIAQFLPVFILGLVLGSTVIRRRTLWASVVAHAIYNGLGYGLMVLVPVQN